MFQLVLAVMGISLTALVLVAGLSSLTPDYGVRRVTTETVATSYRGFEGAVSAYRISNGGSKPPPSVIAGEPWASLGPYMPNGAMAEVHGMGWSYVTRSGAGYLCLSKRPDQPVSRAVREGVAVAASRVDGTAVGRDCSGASDANAAPDSPETPFAATFPVQAGG